MVQRKGKPEKRNPLGNAQIAGSCKPLQRPTDHSLPDKG
jgi:hypothetical protein